MIIALIIAVIVLTVDLVTDYQLWLKYRNVIKPEGSVKHKYGFWIRLAALTPAFILAGWRLAPLIACAYWHLFDGILNLLMRESWFRLGTTAGTDTFQSSHKWLTWLKYIGLIGSVIFFIYA